MLLPRWRKTVLLIRRTRQRLGTWNSVTQWRIWYFTKGLPIVSTTFPNRAHALMSVRDLTYCKEEKIMIQ